MNLGTYKILDREYPIIGHVTSPQTGTVPLVDIPMMSDERWEELCRENAIKHYTEAFGHAPESADVALEWEKRRAGI